MRFTVDAFEGSALTVWAAGKLAFTVWVVGELKHRVCGCVDVWMCGCVDERMINLLQRMWMCG
jgi:hypothetical protein